MKSKRLRRLPFLLALLFLGWAGLGSIGYAGAKTVVNPPHYIEIDKCPDNLAPKWSRSPIHCKIEVPYADRLNAYSIGPYDECRFGTRLNEYNKTATFQYRIKNSKKYRFMGGQRPCPVQERVAESPTCDLYEDPFFGLECSEVVVDKTGSGSVQWRECPHICEKKTSRHCVDLNGKINGPAVCFTRKRSSKKFVIHIQNVNYTQKTIQLAYLIAVKARDEIRSGAQQFSRIYIVDPTIVQEPVVPPPQPPPSTH